jgi:hypothetical protein
VSIKEVAEAEAIAGARELQLQQEQQAVLVAREERGSSHGQFPLQPKKHQQ